MASPAGNQAGSKRNRDGHSLAVFDCRGAQEADASCLAGLVRLLLCYGMEV